MSKHDARGSRGDAYGSSSDGSEVVIVNRAIEPGLEPRAPRIEVRLGVDIESESNFYAGFTENLSECGVFVATHAPLRIGSTVDLWISLPHTAHIRARGTVRWQRHYSESNETAPGMGIRFDSLSAEDTARIHEFAQTRAPMFFDDETTETAQRTTLKP
jgi:uncharacterized protein (TIGR02266 family)